MTNQQTAPFEGPAKNPLASRVIWGVSLLSVLELAEIFTGDPWSVNGLIKMVLWLAGSGLVIWGRWAASQRLRF